MPIGVPAPSTERIRALIDTVPDPEMPPVSVAELGMIVDVSVDAGPDGADVRVTLVPTYSGCPATAVIGADVAAAIRAMPGVASVRVDFTHHVTWTPERISDRGRAKLARFGIAPPGSGQTLLQVGGVRCPVCGSRNTVNDSPFGPTPCRDTYFCNDCRNPFESIKP